MAFELAEAIAGFRAVRRDTDVVITTMGSARDWMAAGPTHPLDFVLVPSSMGQATALGLGLAVARPDLRVIVFNTDGSMLMNLGSLVSISAARPGNLAIVLCDNGVYEVTGGQPTPGSAPGRLDGRPVDYAQLAKAAGFEAVHHCDADRWGAQVRALVDGPGPVFVWLEVAPSPGLRGPRSPGPAPERARRFMAALAEVKGDR